MTVRAEPVAGRGGEPEHGGGEQLPAVAVDVVEVGALHADGVVLFRGTDQDGGLGAGQAQGGVGPLLAVAAHVTVLADASVVAGDAVRFASLAAEVIAVAADRLGVRVAQLAAAVVASLAPVARVAAFVGALLAAVRGDEVTREVAAVVRVDCALGGGHGGDAATGVGDLLPGAILELALEAVAGAEHAVLDLGVPELVGAEHVARRVEPAEAVDARARPHLARQGEVIALAVFTHHSVLGGTGLVHGLLPCWCLSTVSIGKMRTPLARTFPTETSGSMYQRASCKISCRECSTMRRIIHHLCLFVNNTDRGGLILLPLLE